jgi:PPP family 3-phenylpropionic acid transporter
MTRSPAGSDAPPHVVLRLVPFYGSMYLAPAVASVFAGIWFSARGLTDAQIGVLYAAPVLVLLALNLWIGRIADRASDWRGVIVAGAVLSGAAALLLPVAWDFWTMLAVWTLTGAAFGAILPVCDAATMRLSRRAGFDYASVRAWASVGYLVMLLVTGFVLSRYGAWLFLPLFCAMSVVRALAALPLPRFRAAGEAAPARNPAATPLLRAMRPWFLLPLVGGALISATHHALAAFQALLWADQGLSEATIAVLIALGAASEVATFFLFPRLGARIPARVLILISAAVSAGRWACYGLSPPVAVLVPLQLLHGFTYAFFFLGCLTFIANWTAEDIAAEAQSFFVVLQQGAAVLTLLAFGWLAGHVGAQAYLGLAVIPAVGFALVWLSLRMQPARLG